jgi:hypothetical protein
MIPAHFDLVRHRDVSGVSGTGTVAYGWTLPWGAALLYWPGQWPTWTLHVHGVASIRAIHGHDGATEIVWRGP